MLARMHTNDGACRGTGAQRMLRSVNALVLAGVLSAMPVLASAATMQVLYPFAKSGASGSMSSNPSHRSSSVRTRPRSR